MSFQIILWQKQKGNCSGQLQYINLLYLLNFESWRNFHEVPLLTTSVLANWNFYSCYFPVEGPPHAWLPVPALISALDEGRLRVPITQLPPSPTRHQDSIWLVLQTDLNFFSWFSLTELLLHIWLIIALWVFQPLGKRWRKSTEESDC